MNWLDITEIILLVLACYACHVSGVIKGIDRAKMRLYDLEKSAQQNLNTAGIKLNLEDTEESGVDKIISKVKKLRDFSSIKV